MLLKCDNLAVNYGKRPVLKNVSLQIDQGEIISVIGPNGSGKSTLFKALIGAVPTASGTIKKAKTLSIGYVPQKLHIDSSLPLTVSRFMNLPRVTTKAEVKQALHKAGVGDLRKQQLMNLSGGEFQRVLLARALLVKPQLLLLDEATQGLDHRGTAEFYKKIAQVRDELGCAIMMISHELHVVMSQTDRVICLNGHICCQGKPEAVSDSPEYQSLFGLGKDHQSALYLHHDHHKKPHHGDITSVR